MNIGERFSRFRWYRRVCESAAFVVQVDMNHEERLSNDVRTTDKPTVLGCVVNTGASARKNKAEKRLVVPNEVLSKSSGDNFFDA